MQIFMQIGKGFQVTLSEKNKLKNSVAFYISDNRTDICMCMYTHVCICIEKPVEGQKETSNRVLSLRREVQEIFFNVFLHILDF